MNIENVLTSLLIDHDENDIENRANNFKKVDFNVVRDSTSFDISIYDANLDDKTFCENDLNDEILWDNYDV